MPVNVKIVVKKTDEKNSAEKQQGRCNIIHFAKAQRRLEHEKEKKEIDAILDHYRIF